MHCLCGQRILGSGGGAASRERRQRCFGLLHSCHQRGDLELADAATAECELLLRLDGLQLRGQGRARFVFAAAEGWALQPRGASFSGQSAWIYLSP